MSEIKNKSKIVVPVEIIQSKIYLIRGRKVMFDRDLAELYGVPTGHLNRAVKRNLERFPNDFMFQITTQEFNSSRCQIGILKRGKNIKYLPFVFTEQGVAMLSSVLNSKMAIQVNIQIMRVFVKIKKLMLTHRTLARKIEELEKKFKDHDVKIFLVFKAIKELLEEKEEISKNKVPFDFAVHKPDKTVNKSNRK